MSVRNCVRIPLEHYKKIGSLKILFFYGGGGAKTDEHLRLINYPHDIITFSWNPANSNFEEFLAFYEKGLSLQEISQITGSPKSTIRDLFFKNKVALRSNVKSNEPTSKKPKRSIWGAIPYGFQLLDGRLVIDPRETKVIRRILLLHQKNKSFNLIAKTLSKEKIPSKTGKKWNDKTVARIIRRTKAEKNILED